MVQISSLPGTSSESQSTPAPFQTIKQLKEDALRPINKTLKSASPINLIGLVTKLADTAQAKEAEGDLHSALYHYFQAASVLEFVSNHHEYQQECAPGRHGALYSEVRSTMKRFTEISLPHFRNAQERYKELEQSVKAASYPSAISPASPSDDGPVERSGGSLKDRIRALEGAGMNTSTVHSPRASISGSLAPKRYSAKPEASDSTSAATSPTLNGASSPLISGSSSRGHRHLNSLSQSQSVTFSPPLSTIAASFVSMPPGNQEGPTSLEVSKDPSEQPYIFDFSRVDQLGQSTPVPHSYGQINGVLSPTILSPKPPPLHSPLIDARPPSLTPHAPPLPSQPSTPSSSQQTFLTPSSRPVSLPPSSSRPPSHPPTPTTTSRPLSSHSTGGSAKNGPSSHRNSISGPLPPQSTGGSFALTPSISHFNATFPSIGELDDRAFDGSVNGIRTAPPSTEEYDKFSNDPAAANALSSLNGLPSVGNLPALPTFPSVPTGKVGQKTRPSSMPPPPSVPPPKDLWQGIPRQPKFPDTGSFPATRTEFNVNGATNVGGSRYPNGQLPSTSEDPYGLLSASADASRSARAPITSNTAGRYDSQPPVSKDVYAAPPPSHTTTIHPPALAKYLASAQYKVLLLDVRDREAFEAERIAGGAIVCIEPILLQRRSIGSSVELEGALVESEQETRWFSERNQFDLVVMYDQGTGSTRQDRSGQLLAYQGGTSPEGQRLFTTLNDLIYENELYKLLKRSPMILVGGMDAWVKEFGRDSHWVARKRQRRGSKNEPISLRKESRTIQNGVNGRDYVTQGDQNAARSGSSTVPVGAMNSMVNGYDRSKNPSITNVAEGQVPRHGSSKVGSHSREAASTDQYNENLPPGIQPEPVQTLKRKSALFRPSSSGNISAYNRPLNDPSASMYSPITYPSRAISPPITSVSIQQPSTSFSSPPYQHMYGSLSPPPPAHSPSNLASPSSRRRSDYLEQAQYPYSGSAPQSTTRVAIDYPTLSAQNHVQVPPPAAATTMERNDPRSRTSLSSGIAGSSGAGYHSSYIISRDPRGTGPILIDGKPLLPPPTIKSYYPVRYWTRDSVGLSGLKNLGNTCYMNSIIQCLSATVPFARFFIDGRWKGAINLNNPLGTRGAVAHAFATLVHDMWNREVPVQSPYPFKKQISSYAEQFSGNDQHDSQEFLSFLMDGLHEDLNRVLVKPTGDTPSPERELELETLPQQIASAQEWKIYQMRDDSLVVDYFQGQFRNKLQCLTCGKTSTTYNAFMYLSLPIPSGRHSKVTLDQCLQAFVQEETLEKSEAWNCPQCKVPRRATKQLSLSRLPPVLLIHLKRFFVRGHFTDKLETPVDFPVSGLDLTNYMPPPLPPSEDKAKCIALDGPSSPDDPRSQLPPYKYDLYGVTNHFGTLSGGHYTAFIGSKGSWVYADDSRIREAHEREVVGPPAYILFYKRVPPS